MRDFIFGFEITPRRFRMERAKVPKGFVSFRMRGQTANDIVCHNCKTKGAGFGGGKQDTTFQDKEIEKLFKKVMKLADREFESEGWKCSFDLFSTIIDEETDMMLKCHPSRFALSKFHCCNCEIWHDWVEVNKMYYKPTGTKTLDGWF